MAQCHGDDIARLRRSAVHSVVVELRILKYYGHMYGIRESCMGLTRQYRARGLPERLADKVQACPSMLPVSWGEYLMSSQSSPELALRYSESLARFKLEKRMRSTPQSYKHKARCIKAMQMVTKKQCIRTLVRIKKYDHTSQCH